LSFIFIYLVFYIYKQNNVIRVMARVLAAVDHSVAVEIRSSGANHVVRKQTFAVQLSFAELVAHRPDSDILERIWLTAGAL
jgi:hypothetical protein